MIYNGKAEAEKIREQLKSLVATLSLTPRLAVIAVSPNPAINSFITIKRKFGEAIGIHVDEFYFDETVTEEIVKQNIITLAESKKYNGIIIQLPLPRSLNTKVILNTIPPELDVDVLGEDSWNTFKRNSSPIPPVAGAVAHILNDRHIDISNKNVVIIGQGILVGLPVTEWFKLHNVAPHIIDITTSEEIRRNLYKQADIVITGIGVPHHLKKEFFKDGVILIDAGTSEQAGVLAGDCDPTCADIASVLTPVPGGVGPLTVAYLFKNVAENAKRIELSKE